jgi:hypothetical protein
MSATHDYSWTDNHFDLIVRDGKPGFRLCFTDSGVLVDADALRVMRDGTMVSVPFAEIRSVRLSLASTGRSGMVGMCAIELASGQRFVISTIQPSGLADPSKEGIYRRFIEAFHARLVDSGAASHIGFSQGFTAARRTVLLVALIAGGILFIGGPLFAFALSQQPKALIALVIGAALLIPFVRIYNTNVPRNYSPTNPPDLLP